MTSARIKLILILTLLALSHALIFARQVIIQSHSIIEIMGDITMDAKNAKQKNSSITCATFKWDAEQITLEEVTVTCKTLVITKKVKFICLKGVTKINAQSLVIEDVAPPADAVLYIKGKGLRLKKAKAVIRYDTTNTHARTLNIKNKMDFTLTKR